MEIQKAESENILKKIDCLIWDIWKSEFDLDDRYNQVEKYKKCEVYFIKEKNEIISTIIFIKEEKSKTWKNYIWRFATKKEHRWKWYWTKLIKHILDRYKWKIFLDADINQIGFYKKFWFIEIWKNGNIWNTKSCNMIRK